MDLTSSLAEVEALKRQISSIVKEGSDPRLIPRSGLLLANGRKTQFSDHSEDSDDFFQKIREAARTTGAVGVVHLTPAVITLLDEASGGPVKATVSLLVLQHVGTPHRRAWVRGSLRGTPIPWTEVDHQMLPSRVPFFFGS